MRCLALLIAVVCALGEAPAVAQGRRDCDAARGAAGQNARAGAACVPPVELPSTWFRIEPRPQNQQTTVPRLVYPGSALGLSESTKLWVELCEESSHRDALGRPACLRPFNAGVLRDVSLGIVNQETLDMYRGPVSGKYVLIWRNRGAPLARSSPFTLIR